MNTAQQPETLDLRSQDTAEDKRREILRLFPEIRTEGGKIDFERLKLALGEAVDVGRERYGMNWPGKAECFKTIQAPSLGTLRPCPEESVNFDTTENLIIEGDNLEVLKLLQKSYLGKVKMIYIDPPYNTGNDFIYPDNYTESLQTYLEYTGQVDAEGRRFGTNSDADGRFHSKWLNMMYPRLSLARNLLRDDGIVFISIDDTEVGNLRSICDEIFGQECFIIDLIWRKRDGAPNDRTIGSVHDHILVYGKMLTAKSSRTIAEESLNLMPRSQKADAEYQVFREPGGPDPRGRFRKIDTTANAKGGRNVPSLHFGIRNPYTNEVVYPRDGTCWRHSEAEMKRLQEDGRLYWGVAGTSTTPMRKLFLSEAKQGMSTPSILPDMPLNQHAARELEVLFGKKGVFDTPKPVELLRLLVHIGSDSNSCVLDFFAGSGSLGEAVMSLNARDSSERRFILVQLPESLNPEDKDQKFAADFCDEIGKPRNVAELTKERLRRAAKSLAKENPLFSGDTGFRVFKLDQSNFTTWDAAIEHDPAVLERQLELHIEHIRDGRTDDDILYELLLKSGYPLTVPVEKQTLAGKTVYNVAGGLFIICLERKLTLDLIRAIAERKPERVVLLDEGFAGNDQLKANAVQIFKTKGVTSFKTV